MAEETSGVTMGRMMLLDAEEQVRMGLCGLVARHQSAMGRLELVEIPSDMIAVLCTMDSSKIINQDAERKPIADGELCLFTNRLPMIMTDTNPHRDMLESMIGLANVRPIQTMAWFQALERCFEGQSITNMALFQETFLSVTQKLQLEVIDVDHACLRGLLSSLDVVGCIRTVYTRDGEDYLFQSYIEARDWFEITTQRVSPTEKGSMFIHPLEREYNGNIDELHFRCLQHEGVLKFQYTVPVPVGAMTAFSDVQRQIKSIRSKVQQFVAMRKRHQQAQEEYIRQMERDLTQGRTQEE
jgi:hypothetical protein